MSMTFKQSPCTIASVTTGHAEIAVRESGTGLPIVFLHGNACSKDVFAHQLESNLAEQFRLVAIDLPGHGESSNAFAPEQTYSLPGYADAVIETLEMLGIERAVFVGWSLGGHVALEIMASFPGTLGVMLVGTPPMAPGVATDLLAGFHPHAVQMLAAKSELSAKDIALLQTTIAGNTQDAALAAHLTLAIRRCDARARQSLMTSLFVGDFVDERELVGRSPVPLAVLNGANDPLVNTDYIAALAYANLWEGRARLLPNVGHMAFAEVPDLFNQILRRFAAQVQACAHETGSPLGLCLSA